MELIKKIYLEASGDHQNREISRGKFCYDLVALFGFFLPDCLIYL